MRQGRWAASSSEAEIAARAKAIIDHHHRQVGGAEHARSQFAGVLRIARFQNSSAR